MQVTKKDILEILSLIRVNFDGEYNTKTQKDELALISSWYEILKDYPKELCQKAVVLTLKEAEFVPRIGTIVKAIERLISAKAESDEQLWEAIESVLWEIREQLWQVGFTAVCTNGKTQGQNATERIEEIFNDLPLLCKEYLRSKTRLINIATADEKTVNIERACFLKALPKLRETQKLKSQLENLLTERNTSLLKN